MTSSDSFNDKEPDLKVGRCAMKPNTLDRLNQHCAMPLYRDGTAAICRLNANVEIRDS
jgi:hypothetical protein